MDAAVKLIESVWVCRGVEDSSRMVKGIIAHRDKLLIDVGGLKHAHGKESREGPRR
jgi:hypothetical protein